MKMYSIFVMTKPSSSASIPFELAKKPPENECARANTNTLCSDQCFGSGWIRFFCRSESGFKKPGYGSISTQKKKIRSGFRPKDPDPERWFWKPMLSLSLSLKPTGRPKVNTPESPALHTLHLTRHILFNSSSSTLIIPLHIRIIYEYNHTFSSYSSSTYPFLILLSYLS